MSSETAETADSPNGEYDGFSDYAKVSRSIAASIDRAVESYAVIQSRHKEGARVDTTTAAEASSHILGAAIKLLPELQANKSEGEPYQEILEAWTGDDGHIEQLQQTQLTDTTPEWLHEFVVQIRKAGFHSGYLKAGRWEGGDDVEYDGSEVDDIL